MQPVMKAVCAILAICGSALAEKTVVSVTQGQVRTETGAGSTTVDAGQKVVLASGGHTIKGVDDPMVEDLVAISRWIDEERAAGRFQIESASVQIVAIEGEKKLRGAVLLESVNRKTEATTSDHIGNMSGALNPQFYDMSGRLLKYNKTPRGGDRASYDVQLVDPVAPGASLKYICVTEADAPRECLWSDGKIWHAWVSNGSPKCLNYFRFVLPKSAVLIHSNPRAVAVDESGGRVTATVRNYTGRESGAAEVLFLWPDRDGGTLQDVPWEYRDPQSWNAELCREYHGTMGRIRAGHEFKDQSTPLATLLTRNAALMRHDREGVLATVHAPEQARRQAAQKELDKLESEWGGPQAMVERLVEPIDSLQTTPWPKNPPQGSWHQIELFRKGAPLPFFTIGFCFSDNQWSIAFSRPGPAAVTDAEWKAGRAPTASAPSGHE